MPIPRILHQVWLGGPMPEQLRAHTRTWPRHHPSWEYRLWRDRDVESFLVNRDAYDAARTWAERSDIARLEIMLRCGGVYADTDVECLRPLDELLAGVEAFVSTADFGAAIENAVLGTVPGHPYFAACVEQLPVRTADPRVQDPCFKTGPSMMSDVFRHLRELTGRPPLTVFPKELFYPYNYAEPHRRTEHFPDAYTAHHWALSWVEAAQHGERQCGNPYRRPALRLARRLP
ncbi:hypothetical protein CTZ27_02875 [Streptomyces griseocarneus]|nr:hypothetical protein CTZ27_02875 [Streptomyces griseocarneus]